MNTELPASDSAGRSAPKANAGPIASVRGAGRLFGRVVGRRGMVGKILLCAAAFLSPDPPAAAQTQLQQEQVNSILLHAMKDRGIPGLQIAVIANGRIVFLRSYGVANLQTPVRVDDKTIFTLNSITKAFTGVAAMQEVERGRLDLSAPISRYLEDIPAAWGKVTVRQLFGQVSGLPDIVAYGDSELMGIADEEKAWKWALSQPVAPPGEAEVYCQTNLALVQRIINRLNGRSPDVSVIERQLSIAGMTQTAFGDSRDVIENKSQPYRHLNSEGVLRNHFEQFGPMLHAGSGLNSTANDMARWMLSVLDGRQLGEKARAELWTPVKLNDGSLSSFAIGWGVDQRRNYLSVGMSGGGRSAFSLYPKYGVGVVILTNLLGSNPEDLTDEIAAAFDPRITLSGVIKVRSEAEKTDFADLPALLAAARADGSARDFSQDELAHWITSLLWSGDIKRALTLAQFYAEQFPSSPKAKELLGKAYAKNGLKAEAEPAALRKDQATESAAVMSDL